MIQAITKIRIPCQHARSRGQALVEYALVLAFISVLCIMVLSVMGLQIRGLFLNIIAALHEAGGGF
jgi:Flp pilus assembly pilin Flp